MSLKNEIVEMKRLWSGYWPSRVLLTANNYRLFDHLGTPRSAAEVADLLATDVRATGILLDALAGLGLLLKSAGKYRNSVRAKRFLVAGAPHYLGDIIRHAETLWQSWSRLDEVVKTGAPPQVARDNDAFIRGMHNLASLKARDVVKAVDLKGVKRALDLGGGPGTYSMAMAAKGVSVTLFDLPDTVGIAREIVGAAGVTGVDFLTGDFLVDEIGAGYDLIFISQILHAFSAEENLRILRKCRAALNPGGRVAIQEFPIDPSLTSPPASALFSVNMLVNTRGGRCYAPGEMKRWLAKAGFGPVAEKKLEETVLVIGQA